MQHEWGSKQQVKYFSCNTKGKRDQLEKPRHCWKDNTKWVPNKLNVRVYTGFIWFKLGINGGLLWKRYELSSFTEGGYILEYRSDW